MELNFYDYLPMITQGGYHVLIAGCTGSGKSVMLNGLILHTLTIPGSGLYLIDPKRVELSCYQPSSHCISYGDTYETIEDTLKKAVAEMKFRFSEMKFLGIRKTFREPRYIIIDELAQFSHKVNKEYAKLNPLLSELATLGRAANMFLIACTQRPTNDTITPLFKINCDCKIALRCATEQESRNIIEISDARYLPKHGQCIIRHPDLLEPMIYPVDYYEDAFIENFARTT